MASKMENKLSVAAQKLDMAAELAATHANAYRYRRSTLMPSIEELNLRERAQWAREAADVLDAAADGYREVFESTRPVK